MPDFAGLLTANVIDTIIIIVLLIYLVIGLAQGFVLGVVQLLTYLLSAFLAFKFTSFLASTFAIYIPLPLPMTSAIIFLLIILLTQYFFHKVITVFGENVSHSYQGVKKNPLFKVVEILNHVAGVIPALGQAAIFSALLMAMIFLFAGSRSVKFFVLESKYGNPLIEKTVEFEQNYDSNLINAVRVDLLAENITRLPFSDFLTTREAQIELDTLGALNTLRNQNGLQTIPAPEGNLTIMAQKHARNIIERGYISHYDIDGRDLRGRFEQVSSVTPEFETEHILLTPATELPVFDSFTATDSAELKQLKEDFISPDFKDFGIGVVSGKNHKDKLLYVFIFTSGQESTSSATF